MGTVCEIDKCTGCMACLEKCKCAAITLIDSLNSYNMVIDKAKCINCHACENVCPNNNPPQKNVPIKWYQGWVDDEGLRQKSSSGGLASILARCFIESGGICFSCALEDGKFVFIECSKIEDVQKIVGSKYVKSNPMGLYTKVRNYLLKNRKVLVIGLPCQIAAIKNFLGKELSKDLYLVDLICHGTPSPQLLDMFLKENGYDLKLLKNIYFRTKNNFGISLFPSGVRDRYMKAFLSSLDYTENCYYCDYASVARVSDITLGDSWGSELSDKERKKGVSLIFCQTAKGEQLLDNAKLKLFAVDKDIAIEKNMQLSTPSKMHIKRDVFFQSLKRHNNFSKAVFKCFPQFCIRQNIKSILIKLGIDHWGGKKR